MFSTKISFLQMSVSLFSSLTISPTPLLCLSSLSLVFLSSLMQPLRRKSSLFSSYTAAMKHRKNNNLSVFVVVFSVFLFGFFMYNEDLKSKAEFPFSKPKLQKSDQSHENPLQESSNDGVILTNSRTTIVVESKIEEEHKIEEEEEQRIELPVLVAVAATAVEEAEEDDEEIE